MPRRGAHDLAHHGSEPGTVLAVAAVVVAGPFAAVGAFVLRRWVGVRPGRLAGAAVVGLVLVVALWPVTRSHALLAIQALIPSATTGQSAPGLALKHGLVCWLALAPSAPALAWFLTWLVPPTVRDLERRAQRRADRAQGSHGTLGRRGPLRSVQAAELAEAGDGVVLGERIAGDPVLPATGRDLVLPLPWLGRHALVIGASGSGKTETLLKIAHEVARRSDWGVFFIDGKGDRDTMRRFHALMVDAGRAPRLFPDEGYDGWRGSATDIAARLVEVIDFAEEGPGAYYRDQAVNVVRLACEAPGGPPRSAAELLHRLDHANLEVAYRDDQAGLQDVWAYTARQVAEVRARYSAFFGSLRRRLDDGWAFEDATAGYLLLDGLRLKHEAARLARLLIEDFTQYAVERKPRGQRVLLIVDEFSAIAQAGTSLVDVVERTRGFGVAAILSPQVVEGMGTPEAAARIIGSAHTILLHSVPSPEEIVKVAGTRLVMETSVQHDQGRATGLGSARLQHAFRVDPNEVRRLPVGVCFAIRAGQAATVRIARAPELANVELPAPVQLHHPVPPSTPAADDPLIP